MCEYLAIYYAYTQCKLQQQQKVYVSVTYNGLAHLSRSVVSMIPSVQGLSWFECCEISKELFIQCMFNGQSGESFA